MAALTTPPDPQRTVVLKCQSLGETYAEGRVATSKTVSPGMLIERIAQGDTPDRNWQPHSTSGGRAEKAVAQEKGFIGDVHPITNALGSGGLDDDYVAGDLLRIHICKPGDELYMLLKDGQSATEASFLMSNGDGKLAVVTSTNQALFKALETVAASGADARIRVRAL